MSTILLVDDDDKVRNNIKEYLEAYDYKVDKSSSSIDAINKIKENNYLLIITDVLMEHSTAGIDVLNFTKKQDANIKVVIFTAHMTDEIKNNKKVFKCIDKNSENAYLKVLDAIKSAKSYRD